MTGLSRGFLEQRGWAPASRCMASLMTCMPNRFQIRVSLDWEFSSDLARA